MPRKVLTTVAPAPREDVAVQIEVTLPVRQRRRETRGQPGSASHPGSRPRIPRITRLMALAIKFQDMVDCGEVRDYADLGRLGYVTRARITQIMNLLHLAPDIQERVLFFQSDADPMWTERRTRNLTVAIYWSDQRTIASRLSSGG